ncbi:28S ribosomal protein S18b, mitochondrial [Apis mellifera caucasica]|uniref:Small ribosomal subunit protein mS40 n=1 Tax=Apis mellifera TaxID=7460 RepID=A0A7M7GPK0_APIME|nr:28S ribosomal protein S18b, mitochondrial [Apis mellifera]KAG6803661.1 28S ribosomal protein S18b, mitochondrial [Apis mellifera caucasica]KAG9430683.1 28S ribosomal protein S18b, mitochondrial [Apis mellifera carnica]|eukprot:XP_006562866.2 28S ribosomal protein S18b, mitochondrial [Apis mellifera]
MLLINKLQLAASLFKTNLTIKVISVNFIHSTFAKYDKIEDIENDTDLSIPLSKDRSKIIPVDISIKYLKSSAYKQTYGNEPIWKYYKRNFKGHIPPIKTRKTCIRSGIIATGSPCPICRDEYLVLDYRNVDLLKQFISKDTGEILNYDYTSLCQKAYKDLLVAIMKSREYGLFPYHVPFRYYDYSEWKN